MLLLGVTYLHTTGRMCLTCPKLELWKFRFDFNHGYNETVSIFFWKTGATLPRPTTILARVNSRVEECRFRKSTTGEIRGKRVFNVLLFLSPDILFQKRCWCFSEPMRFGPKHLPHSMHLTFIYSFVPSDKSKRKNQFWSLWKSMIYKSIYSI